MRSIRSDIQAGIADASLQSVRREVIGEAVHTELLASLEPYAPEQVQAVQQEVERIRQVTVNLKDEARLWHRVEHLRRIVAVADEVQADLGPTSNPDWKRVRFE
jgi:hypothetical protein